MKPKNKLMFFLTLRGMRRTLVPALLASLVLVTGCCSLMPSHCKPTILQQPESQVALVGTPATFTVVAQHPPPNTNATLTYQWTFNGANIPGATSNSFTIPAVAPSDLGAYRVVVSGSPSTTSEPAYLSIATAPSKGNAGSVQTLVDAFISTNTSPSSCPHSFNRFYPYYFFNGPNVPENLRTPVFANSNGKTKLQVDTCNSQNSAQNVTAVKIVKNNIQATALACDDDGSTTCTVFPTPSTHSNADANLPTENDTRGLVRVIIYFKASSIPTGQTSVTFNWNYHD